MPESELRSNRRGPGWDRTSPQAVAGEAVKAIFPYRFPPDPQWDLGHCMDDIECADRAVGRLDGFKPSPGTANLLLYSYRSEKSRMSSFVDRRHAIVALELLLFENKRAPGVPVDDVEEFDYVVGDAAGLRRMAQRLSAFAAS